MLELIRQGFEQKLPKQLVSELLEAYGETKSNYYLNKFRPNEVEGGRFCEAAFRILEVHAFGTHTPIGRQLDTEKLILRLQGIPFGQQQESVRLHLPRTLRLIYDIRNKRDAAHLADGIDPNPQDATFVVAACDWVLAELVRLYHSVSPQEAQKMVESIIERKSLVVQDFDGFLKTLKPAWGPKERLLATLYQRGRNGATVEELSAWLKPSQRSNINRTLGYLEHENDFILSKDGRYFITNRGIKHVEGSGMLTPE